MSESGPAVAVQEGDAEALDATKSTPPEDPMVPAGRWIKDNLFSTKGNTIQTVFFALLMVGLAWWILGIVFADESDWTSVGTNMRLLMSYNYPTGQYVRVWFTIGALATAAGLSMGAWRIAPTLTFRRIGVGFMGTGSVLLVIGLIAPARNAPARYAVGILVVAAVVLITGIVMTQAMSNPHLRKLSFETVLLATVGLLIAILWIYPFGKYELRDGEIIAEAGLANVTTRGPWTVSLLILAAAYFAGKMLSSMIGEKLLRSIMVLWWVIGPAFLIFLVLRDPEFDWDKVWRVDVPGALAFGLIGGALLYALTKPGVGEFARVVGAGLLLFAAALWVIAFNGWGYESFFIPLDMPQKFRLSFLMLSLFALAAPTFAGEKSARLRFAGIWVGLVFIGHWLITGINTSSTLDIAAPPFLGGLVLSCAIAYYVMLASFPLGIILALARTSKMPIFRVLSTTYIEIVRGIPLITVLFFFSIMLPLFLPGDMDISELAAIFAGYSVFSAAYMAENIRGGLQSVRKGQYEAADALGLTTVQRTSFIVLPQALRVSIPNLVGQAIATFKETSLIAIVGGFDLLRVADKSISAQPEFLGQKRPALLFVCVVYWIFAYSMSRASRNLEVKLGVGEG